MMEAFRIRPLTEDDVRTIVEKCGGVIAHPDAQQRSERGGDFVFAGAAIELKVLEEDGLQKSERQAKLAHLFREEGYTAPVVVLDRASLSELGQRAYDRAIEGPIKNAVASARRQLKQTRAERPSASLSVLWIVNNGYTALNHEELTALVVHRVRNDTSQVDGVIVGGCYYHSDGFDSFFLWPLTYVPISLNDFTGFDDLKAAWEDYAESFMTRVVLGNVGPVPYKGPVVDTQFEIDGVTYVKPAPPIGGQSHFFVHGRPRKNSIGLMECPPVAVTFPGLSQQEWNKFRRALPDEPGLCDAYAAWLQHEQQARGNGVPLRPLVRVPVSFDDWQEWRCNQGQPPIMASIYEYSNVVFQEQIQTMIASAREMKQDGLVPSRYILVVTDEIGQDKANDLSHIAMVRHQVDDASSLTPLVENLRIFHEHAVALASAYALAEGFHVVLWKRNQRYAWA